MKEQFVLEIENSMEGKETLIPKMLSQDHLSFSYRFYDPILMIIKTMIKQEKQDIFTIQRNLRKKNYKDSVATIMKKSIGLMEDEKSTKMKQSQVAVNKKVRKEMNVYLNPDSKGI